MAPTYLHIETHESVTLAEPNPRLDAHPLWASDDAPAPAPPEKPAASRQAPATPETPATGDAPPPRGPDASPDAPVNGASAADGNPAGSTENTPPAEKPKRAAKPKPTTQRGGRRATPKE